MEERDLYPSLIEKLRNDFALEKESLPAINDLTDIRSYLIARIKILMAGDFQRFLNSLYRIDVSENKVLEIIHSKDKISIPERLADLIIERQLMRLRTQLYYKQNKSLFTDSKE